MSPITEIFPYRTTIYISPRTTTSTPQCLRTFHTSIDNQFLSLTYPMQVIHLFPFDRGKSALFFNRAALRRPSTRAYVKLHISYRNLHLFFGITPFTAKFPSDAARLFIIYQPPAYNSLARNPSKPSNTFCSNIMPRPLNGLPQGRIRPNKISPALHLPKLDTSQNL
jgi:hypothetical protein